MWNDLTNLIQIKYGSNWSKKKWIELLAVFFLLMGFPILAGGYDKYYYDGVYYFYTGDSVFANGFDLLAFPETFRGYLLPVTISFLKLLFTPFLGANSWVSYSVFSSLLTAVFITVILPYLFEIKSSIRLFIGEIVTTCLVLFFWGDFLQYPLADLPAMVYMGIAVALLKYICKKEISGVRGILLGLAIGAFFYASYSAKVTYRFGAVIALIWLFVFYRKKSILKVLIPGMLIGAFVMAVPQMLINAQYTGQYTPKVLTEMLFGYGNSLEITQLYTGLSSIRLESYVGDHAYWLADNIVFRDVVGEYIVNTYTVQNNITVSDIGILDFIKIFFQYPMDMIGIYTRRLVSLMTPLYRNIYVHDLFTPKGWNVLLSFLIWFATAIGACFTLKGKVREFFTSKSILLYTMLFPNLLTIVGMSEIRFFIFIYFAVYFLVCCVIDWRKVFAKIKIHALKVVFSFVLILCLWTGVVSSLMTNMNEVFLINDTSKQFISSGEIYNTQEVSIPNSNTEINTMILDSAEKIGLEDGVTYKLSFDLDCSKTPDILYLDLYGTNYDLPQYDFSYNIKEGKYHYTTVFSPSDMPEDTVIRIICQTEQEYKLENIKIEKGIISR